MLETNSSQFNSYRLELRRWLQIEVLTLLEVDFNMPEIRFTVKRPLKITLNLVKLTRVEGTMVTFIETQQLMKVLVVLGSHISRE